MRKSEEKRQSFHLHDFPTRETLVAIKFDGNRNYHKWNYV